MNKIENLQPQNDPASVDHSARKKYNLNKIQLEKEICQNKRTWIARQQSERTSKEIV